jgi:fatty-acyl-CoA synthase
MENEFLNITIGNLLDLQARDYGDHDAVVYVDRGLRLNYRQYRDVCNRAAKGFMQLGVKKGEHVAIWATNYPEWLFTQMGTAKMGAVLVTVNPSYRTNELEYLLRQSDTTTLVLIRNYRDANYVQMVNELVPELATSKPGELSTSKFPCLKNVIYVSKDPSEPTPPGMFSWNELLAMGAAVSDAELQKAQASTEPEDVINIQYTSGTTGYPKGAMLTHRNIVGDAKLVTDCLNLTPQDRLCAPVPFYHCFGCVMANLGCLTKGATLVPIETYDAKQVLEAVQAERCTTLYGVPTMFIGELNHPDFARYDLSSLRTGIMAGSPCPIEVMKAVVDKMGAREITIAYGQTETSPVSTQTRTDDPLERRVTTVGRALPGLEGKVVDPTTGETMLPGQIGEYCVRGFTIMQGYYKMPEETAKTIDRDGWLHSGDLATMDADGYFNITGRIKDMIIRGGENIYPREIEEFLYTNPKVADVQVIGMPSAKYGEEVMAWVKLKEGQTATEDEIREFCRGKIANYKIPRYVKFVEAYPMTVTGKIQKYKMRQQSVEELGLQQAAAIKTA